MKNRVIMMNMDLVKYSSIKQLKLLNSYSELFLILLHISVFGLYLLLMLNLLESSLKSLLWRIFMKEMLQGYNIIIQIVIGFFVFANVTFFVLMCMDLMECFLHTLRLHWVEFQNKFYKADGYKFTPYSFKYIVASSD